MNDQMHDVETYIGEIGQRCNTKLLEKKWKNLQNWEEKIEAPSTQLYPLIHGVPPV